MAGAVRNEVRMKPVASQHPHGMSITPHSSVSQGIVPITLPVVKGEEFFDGSINGR
jgi:hypothetical protein